MNVYTDGTDTIFGESAEEAVAAYRLEIGATYPEDYTDPKHFSLVAPDKKITIYDRDNEFDWDGGKKTMTAAEWVEYFRARGQRSRLICSTEY